jgi:hypothetical protein
MAAPVVMASTHLLSKRQYWRYHKDIDGSAMIFYSPQSYISAVDEATAKPG